MGSLKTFKKVDLKTIGKLIPIADKIIASKRAEERVPLIFPFAKKRETASGKPEVANAKNTWKRDSALWYSPRS